MKILSRLFFIVLLLSALGCEKDANFYNTKGIAYTESGEYDLAITTFTKAININPDFTETYYNRGKVYSTIGKYNLAIADYNVIVERNPVSSVYYDRGIIYNKLGKYDLALADFTEVIKIDSNFGKAYRDRCELNLYLMNYLSASDDFVKASTLGYRPPDSLMISISKVCKRLGDKSFANKNYSQAIQYYSNLERINPDLLDEIKSKLEISYFEMGSKHFRNIDYKVAIKNYKLANQLNSKDRYNQAISDALFLLAQEEENSKEYSSAISHYKESLKYSIKKKTFVESKVYALTQLENCEKAKEKIRDGDYYYSLIDWNLLEETNKIMISIKNGEYVSEYEKEKLSRNLSRAFKMTQYVLKAHEYYKDAMKISRKGSCPEINSKAFSKNASVITQWMFTSSELIRFLSEMIKNQRGY